MTAQFNIGDTVQLKSGGPPMTVTGYGKDEEGNPRVTCAWFDHEQNAKTGVFPVEAMQDASSHSREGSDMDHGGGAVAALGEHRPDGAGQRRASDARPPSGIAANIAKLPDLLQRS
jgi:uncharacterized protein YodC (DUF2158 family)